MHQRFIHISQHLFNHHPSVPIMRVGELLVGCLLLCQLGFAREEHSTLPEQTAKSKAVASISEKRVESPSCPVDLKKVVKFINRESMDASAAVNFIADRECESLRAGVAREVEFSGLGAPYSSLRNFVPTVFSEDESEKARVDGRLSDVVPGWLRQYPLGSQQWLVLMGQVGLISPTAGRKVLVSYIQNQMVNSQLATDTRSEPKTAGQLASEFVKLGLDKEAIATPFAESVKEMAFLTVQADSLRAILSSLAMASSVENKLIPTLDKSAEAFLEGVNRGEKVYSKSMRKSLLEAVVSATKQGVGSHKLDKALSEFNQAVSKLLAGLPLEDFMLRKFWEDAIVILSKTTTQNNLAHVVGLSLTPEVVYLPLKSLNLLLMAATNYPELGLSLQRNYLIAGKRLEEQQHALGTLPPVQKQLMRELAQALLALSETDSHWLAWTVSQGFLNREEVAMHVSRKFLGYLKRREIASEQLAPRGPLAASLSTMSENLLVGWQLATAHLPILIDWVEHQRKQPAP
ncbi:MAG: hypothetical protein HY537_14060 [Deltaproteobacteria bacterium]|nr:hypothetical protein [Deltaproteobacteria bacterium]